jgi:hypothetical protein
MENPFGVAHGGLGQVGTATQSLGSISDYTTMMDQMLREQAQDYSRDMERELQRLHTVRQRMEAPMEAQRMAGIGTSIFSSGPPKTVLETLRAESNKFIKEHI